MFAQLKDRLEAAVADGGYLNGGLCLIDDAGWEQTHVTGLMHPPLGLRAPEPLTDPGLRLRMASISKAITGRIACELGVGGILPLDAEVRHVLDWPTAPPPMAGVTARMLLNHTSGLTDRAGYLPAPQQGVTGFIDANAEGVASGQAPGQWFRYANLNYVLLGAVLETVTQARFDELARLLVLEPAGIDGGFNWAGVTPARRKQRLPLYQRIGARLEQQTEPEESDWAADVIRADGQGFGYESYVVGRDALLHSPHGGMRMSVIEAARLARLLADDTAAADLQRQTSWRFDPVSPNGTDCDGLYTAFGLGVMLYRDHPRIPGPLIGHAGHALGFTGGAWHNPEAGHSVGFFLTGSADLTEGQEDEAFYAAPEVSLLQAI